GRRLLCMGLFSIFFWSAHVEVSLAIVLSTPCACRVRLDGGGCRSGNLALFPSSGYRSDNMGGLVISGGRVVDPASGMDAIGDVAVVDGQISAVGTGLGGAERVIDATGLVVAPGFIDLH